MLEARALSAGYGRARVLYEMSFEARAGEAVALLGRNGAGKSTTLKALMGLVPSWSGEVRFDGRRIDRLAPYEFARLGLGYVPEDRRAYRPQRRENLAVGTAAAMAARWSEDGLYALFPALGAMRDAAATACRARGNRCWPSRRPWRESEGDHDEPSRARAAGRQRGHQGDRRTEACRHDYPPR
jgi:ABC-type branched-subunit amino acid transport system ATPase component